jgi:cell division protease FtsH
VGRADYRRLYRIALRCRRDDEPPSSRPVLPKDQAELLWKNTIGYLDRKNLRTIKSYGGRAKRGVLLTGEPGNGKTMACRWIWEECRRRNWDWRLVSPDSYRAARASCNPVAAVRQLFSTERRGVVFFDDMDIALRDRETVHETDDQAVFLSALDGITVTEGVVFVFTTNCSLDLIDKAFKRPGRLDLVLHFRPPDASLRRELIQRWHADIREALNLDAAVASTAGHSFAEIEELKNLLIMHFLDTQNWDWSWAVQQFAINRDELAASHRRQVGFYAVGAKDDDRNGDVPF